MSEYLTGNECLNVCRICMVERSTEGYEPFVQLMEPIDGKLMPRQLVLDLMKIDVEPDEYKPTVICHCCFVALDNFHKLIEKGNESQIVINYIAKKNFGESSHSMPGTSKASTSSMMLRNNEASSHSMPGTSTAPTSSLMLRNNEESSHKTSLKNYRSTSKRSNEFVDSMPGTSKASTSSIMLRNKKESSQEPPFKHSRLPSNKFGDSMPGTSTAPTSSLMLRNNEESSHKTSLKNYRSTSKRSNEFGDSMPGTSKASTSSMMLRNNEASSHSMPGTSTAPTSSLMLRNNEESSHKTSLKNYRSTSKRSNEFGDSMPGTSKASTSSIMLRNKKESSQEPPFKHSRLPSNKFGDSMPGTSTAPTSSLMLRNNEESSHKTSLKNYRSTSKRSNEFGDSMPGTSKASTSSMMLRNNEASSHSMPGTSKASTSSMKFRNNEESSHKTPFKNYRTTSKQSNEFGDSMPGTSTAYSSSPMLRNNEESYQELPSKHSRLLSKQPYKFGNSMPGTSSASSSSMLLVVDEELSDETPFKHSQSILKRSNKNGTTLNGRNNSNNYQGNSSRSVITKHLEPEFDDESDDDSCIIITNPTETVVLISDDEDHENENFENVDLSDNEESVELSQDEVIVLSSDSEGNENNIKKENVNKVTEKYFCSICRKKHSLHLNCSQYNKSYFTCLVPGCNILSKSKKDFIYHYQPHIGMSSSGVMCHHCFKGIDQSNIDGNGSHKYCDIKKAFKCYQCNIEHNNIHEFAHHKLKFHSGIFMDTHCNYLCLHCEESSEDKFEMIAHLNHCLESRAQNVTAASMKPKTATELFGIKKNVMVRRNGNKNMIPPTGHHVLFTCLKPSCNIIFQSFSNFKYHYRCHFELGNALVCWQCCKPCPDIPYLRAHQLKNNCRTPGMFKCYECPSKFNDLESLSIHKLTFHKGQLIAGKKNRKTIICAFCQTDIYIFNFQSHLATCQKKNSKNNTCTTKYKGEYTCLTCERVFASPISLSNHSRVHKGSRISNLKKEST